MKPIENNRDERLLAIQRERRRSLSLLALLPLAGALGACSGLIPGQGPPAALYRLTPKSSFREDLPAVDWQLVLETPVTDASLNTTRIGLQQSPTQMEYYARAGWADRAPLMVQTLMIESFENSRRIVAVGREAIGLRADFILKSELREFQAIYYEGLPPKTLVTINAKLVKMPQRTIIGSKSFEIAFDAEADELDAIIAAFDQSLGKVLRRLVEWTLLTGQAASETS